MTAPNPTISAAQAQAAAIIASAAAVDGSALVVSQVSRSTATVIASISDKTKNLLHGFWLNTDPYSNASLDAFVAQANKVLVTAQKATGQTAAAGQSAMLRSMGINLTVVPTLPDDVRTPHARAATIVYNDGSKEVTAADSANEALLQRPASALRWRESLGDTPEAARQFSITRLDDVVDGNLVIAQRDAEHQVLNYKGQVVTTSRTRTRTGAKIVGFRRIIHPEFSAGGVCGLCVAASDRVYHRETLRPVHLRCKCTSAPVTATYDPGQSLNVADLKRLYSDAGGSTSAADLKRTRYTVDYNELGPVLVPAAGETVPYFTPLAA